MLSTNLATAQACASPDGRGVVVVSRYQGRTHQWELGACRYRPTEHTPTIPPDQEVNAIALDPIRRVVVALVRAGNGSFHSIQEFDGSGWRVVPTPAIPLALYDTVSVAYDARARAVSILTTNWQRQTQLHTWDGRTLTTVPGPTSTATSSDWALAFDPTRSRLVAASVGNMTELFEWDGTRWTTVHTPTAASPSTRHAFCYDEALGKILLLEPPRSNANGRLLAYDGTDWTLLGNAPFGCLDPHLVHVSGQGTWMMLGNQWSANLENQDVWLYAAGSWSRVQSAHRPDLRAQRMQGAYDSARKRFVCFHPGVNLDFQGVGQSETWEWDGVRWLLRATSASTTPVLEGVMAYDGARQETVLFNANTTSGSTWLWNGLAWRPAPAPVGPPHRVNGGMAYDALRQQVVLCGGTSASLGQLDDTWTWDGTNWTQRTPATVLPRAAAVGMTFDETRGKIVAVCDTGGSGPTCEWDGTNWTRINAFRPTTQGVPSLAYDRNRQKTMMLVQGLQTPLYEWAGNAWVLRPAARETWYESGFSARRLFFDEQVGVLSHFFMYEMIQLVDVLPTTTVVASGCSGQLPVPTLGQFGEARLQRSDYEIELVAPGHPLAPALVGLGTTPGSIPLAGCTLAMANVDLLWPAALGPTGHARVALPIPADPWFVGRTFRVQALVADGTATAGSAVSTAIELLIGR